MIPFFPEQASTIAAQIDLAYIVLVLLSLVFGLGVAGAITYFAIRYRRGARVDRSNPLTTSTKLEITWSVVPLILGLGMFIWGANLYFTVYRPPEDALEIFVVAKQWMWKLQHPEGQREVNELHVPVGQPIKLTMISQDVIHSFFVPAFRIKRDVIPGRYSTVWFEATQVGEYHLFCTEYCGLDHAEMIGSIIVMEPAEYEAWLTSAGSGALGPGAGQDEMDALLPIAGGDMASRGAQLFQTQGCASCHLAGGNGPGPSLVGIWDTEVALEGGGSEEVDEAYVRSSILLPNQDVVAGYAAIMPSYEGRLDEEEINELIAYIRSLGE